MRPYKQGTDRLCSYYVLANSIKLCGLKLTKKKVQALFDDFSEMLTDQELLSDLMLNGCGRECFEMLIDTTNNHLLKNYRTEFRTTRIFWNERFNGKELCRYIRNLGAVIVRIQCEKEDFDHFTVIRSIDDTHIHFFDSDDLRKVPIDEVSTIDGETKYRIFIRQLYAVQLVKNECS
ncbi:MAG: hypothetical protein LBR70_06630 [Lactobacillaceae bacterium]|jgi:hypothetical protein|nr:hypothetical protein [Lactobacillaceae bacterium]